MMDGNPLLGVFFHWIGGLSSASFYVPYKRIRRWSWEIFWLTGGVFHLQGDVFDGGHVYQFIVASHVGTGADVELITKHVRIGEDTLPSGDDEPPGVID